MSNLPPADRNLGDTPGSKEPPSAPSLEPAPETPLEAPAELPVRSPQADSRLEHADPPSPPTSAPPPAMLAPVSPGSSDGSGELPGGASDGRGSDWGCVAAWGTALLIPALLIAMVALPLLDRISVLDEDYARGLDQLYRYQRLVATLPRLRAELEQAQANDDFKAFYFDAETPGLAGAKLQSEVQEMVRTAGGRPISTQILPVDESEQPPRVRIRTQLQGTTDELLDVLYRIEAARPFLFIDQMSIRSTTPRRRNVRSRGARRPASQTDVGQLTVRLDVFGYVLGGGG